MTPPHIIELTHEAGRAVARLALPPDAAVFKGHFPGLPILSGVAQIDWAMRLAQHCFALAEPVADDFQVKFAHVIEPGAALVLTLDYDPAAGRLNFQYRVADQLMSSGRVKLARAP